MEKAELRRLEEDGKNKQEAYEMRRKILEWLSPDDFEDTHDRHFGKRFGVTGQWLLEDPRFENWRDETQSSLLWCYGARKSQLNIYLSIHALILTYILYCSGLRKNYTSVCTCIAILKLLSVQHPITVEEGLQPDYPHTVQTVRSLLTFILSSLVVEHLSHYQLSMDTGTTFVYCNYTESRTTLTYMRLALKQLCRAIQSFPDELQEVYSRCYSNHSQPKYDELRTVFLAIIQQFGRIFFVLDALDECTSEQRKGLCDFMLSLVDPTGTSQRIVKLFVTSRKESDIEQAFQQKSIPTIEVETAKVNSDIEVYVKAQIELRRTLKHKNSALKNKILNALTTKAGGMYVCLVILMKEFLTGYKI